MSEPNPPAPRRPAFAALLVLGGAILWGTAGPASQVLYDTTATTPVAVALLRIALAAPILLLLAAPGLATTPRPGRRAVGALVIGGVSLALYQLFYFQAVAVSGVALATLTALCPVPILVGLLSRVLLGERRPLPWGAMAGAVAGLALLIGAPREPAALPTLLAGGGLGLLACLAFAGIALSGRSLGSHLPPLLVTTAIFLVAGATLAMAASGQLDAVQAALDAWPVLLFLALVPTVAAYALFYSGVGRTPAAITGVLIVAEPLTATFLGWAVFGEALTALQLAGAALLCAVMIRAARAPAAV